MRVIGLTGGIACGKTHISDTLRELGAVIIDGDQLSRELTAPGGDALPALRESFGDGVFLPDGTLDRRALGSLVFADPEKLSTLNAVMQPRIRQLILFRLADAHRAGVPIAVLDMPLLFEECLDPLCDTVWCAYLPPETQLARLMARDGLSREAAQQRINSQMPTEYKADQADVVIDTSGSIGYTTQLIPPLYARELELARKA